MTDQRFMLDTDTVSYALRGVGHVAASLTACRPSEVCMSSLTLAELRFGADKRRSRKLYRLIDSFAAAVEPVPFDATAAGVFGRIRASLESRGKPIGLIDTLIASHALSRGLTLVTNNTRHFTGIPGLRTANWS